jgi:hypothetical protein
MSFNQMGQPLNRPENPDDGQSLRRPSGKHMNRSVSGVQVTRSAAQSGHRGDHRALGYLLKSDEWSATVEDGQRIVDDGH